MAAAVEKLSRLADSIPVEIRGVIQQAADARGTTLEKFIIEAAHREARETLSEDPPIRLTLEGAERIFELMENPPEPNAAMLEAIALHRKLVRA